MTRESFSLKNCWGMTNLSFFSKPGLPNLACFNFTLNLIQSYTEKIKYEAKKKEAKCHYQGDVSKRKPGSQKQLTVKEKYLIALCRLCLGFWTNTLETSLVFLSLPFVRLSKHEHAYWLKSSMGLYFGGHLVKMLKANFPSLSRITQIPGWLLMPQSSLLRSQHLPAHRMQHGVTISITIQSN